MRMHRKFVLSAGVLLALAVIAVLVVRTWIIPALLVSELRSRLGMRVEIRDWWLNTRSAGVVGLTVHEGTATNSPVLVSADRVTTDLGLSRLLHGMFAPKRVTIKGPRVEIRFDRKGGLLTQFGNLGKGGASTGPIAVPVVIAEGATLTLRQSGRPPLVVTGVTGRVGPDGNQINLAVRSNDRNWGPLEAHGRFDPAHKSGHIEMKSVGTVTVNSAKVAAIPFVPPEVWDNVSPEGEVSVRLTADMGKPGGPPLSLRTEITLHDTTATSRALDLTARRATGRVVVDGGLVRLENVSGHAIDGRVTANGTLDFDATPPKFDLNLDLEHLDVTKAPRSWQLDEAGLTGHLTGKAHLVATLSSKGVDLSGSSGDAVVKQGVIQGIPFESLKLSMHAQGQDLQYETEKHDATSRPIAGDDSSLAPLLNQGLSALSGQNTSNVKPKGTTETAGPGFSLPKTLTTQIELKDVDVARLVQRAQFVLGYPFPIPVSGRLSIHAEATIPLGQIKSIASYAFHGDLTLKGASIYHVDIRRISARIDLDKGVLVLKNLRGRLVDRPNGGPDNPPEAEEQDVPIKGPLPIGGFRGTLQAAISPAGKLSAQFEGNDLPMGELGAPFLPRPTPLSGQATMTLAADVDLSKASDPSAWVASGTVRSQAIRYKNATLDSVSTRFTVEKTRLDVSELTALLRKRPLNARFTLDLGPPQAYHADLNVSGWSVEDVLAWVPNAPTTAPVLGRLTARAEANGTLKPFAVTTQGRGQFATLRAGPVSVGDVPFAWSTEGDTIDVKIEDAHPFGGRVTAEAEIPLKGHKPIAGSADLRALDTSAVSASIPGGKVHVTGKANGQITFAVPADVSSLKASVRLSAPDLTVQGVRVEQVRVDVQARKQAVNYDLTADTLGGKLKLNGELPLGHPPLKKTEATSGEFRAAGFTLEQVWKALGLSGALAQVGGEGAIDANLRAALAGQNAGLYAHGVTEVRELRWGPSAPLGRVRGILAVTPSSWRIDPVNGEILGGVLGGSLWGATPNGHGSRPPLGFTMRVDRASLKNAALLAPALSSLPINGYGTLRISGELGDAFRGSGDFYVGLARVAGLAVNDLRMPIEVVLAGGDGTGSVHVRRWSARIAGGHAFGSATMRLGDDRAFQTDVNLNEVDLESITRLESDAKRPASGKISGKISVNGPDPVLPQRYRGRVDLDLHDASIVSVPVFREMDRFLGAARGGLFEDGDFHGIIANRHVVVESATLVGRLAQVHATGNLGFDGGLNLEVLVNTNQIISQTGQALVSLIPGLGNLRGRDREAKLQVANYLSNRLLKLRVGGNIRSPSVTLDPGIGVGDTAVNFFSGVLKMPLGFVK